MYTGLLYTHSGLRYFVLIMLVAVIIISLVGVINKKPFSPAHNRFSLVLMIATHVQFLLGVLLYIVSSIQGRRVQFNSETMSNPALRYFTVEHAIAMIIAVALITAGRNTAKKLDNDAAKHRRLLVFNSIALLIILGTIYGLGGQYNTI